VLDFGVFMHTDETSRGAKNAGVENAGMENAEVDSRGIATDELSR